MGAQRGGFVQSEPGTPHSEPFDELSARIFCARGPPALGTPREAILRCHRGESSVPNASKCNSATFQSSSLGNTCSQDGHTVTNEEA